MNSAKNEFAVLGGGGVYLVAAAVFSCWRRLNLQGVAASAIGDGIDTVHSGVYSIYGDGNVVGGGGLASKM